VSGKAYRIIEELRNLGIQGLKDLKSQNTKPGIYVLGSTLNPEQIKFKVGGRKQILN